MTLPPRNARGQFEKRRPPSEAAPAADDDDAQPFLVEWRASWQQHGADTIDRVRNERPHDYLRLAASHLGKIEGAAPPDPLAGLNDDEIADELRRILARLAADGADPRA